MGTGRVFGSVGVMIEIEVSYKYMNEETSIKSRKHMDRRKVRSDEELTCVSDLLAL